MTRVILWFFKKIGFSKKEAPISMPGWIGEILVKGNEAVSDIPAI